MTKITPSALCSPFQEHPVPLSHGVFYLFCFCACLCVCEQLGVRVGHEQKKVSVHVGYRSTASVGFWVEHVNRPQVSIFLNQRTHLPGKVGGIMWHGWHGKYGVLYPFLFTLTHMHTHTHTPTAVSLGDRTHQTIRTCRLVDGQKVRYYSTLRIGILLGQLQL